MTWHYCISFSIARRWKFECVKKVLCFCTRKKCWTLIFNDAWAVARQKSRSLVLSAVFTNNRSFCIVLALGCYQLSVMIRYGKCDDMHSACIFLQSQKKFGWILSTIESFHSVFFRLVCPRCITFKCANIESTVIWQVKGKTNSRMSFGKCRRSKTNKNGVWQAYLYLHFPPPCETSERKRRRRKRQLARICTYTKRHCGSCQRREVVVFVLRKITAKKG